MINEVYANVYQLTKPPTNYVSSKMRLIYHLHSSIIQHYDCITVGSHLCFKCLMLLNFSLKDDMTSNTQTSEYYKLRETDMFLKNSPDPNLKQAVFPT